MQWSGKEKCLENRSVTIQFQIEICIYFAVDKYLFKLMLFLERMLFLVVAVKHIK